MAAGSWGVYPNKVGLTTLKGDLKGEADTGAGREDGREFVMRAFSRGEGREVEMCERLKEFPAC